MLSVAVKPVISVSVVKPRLWHEAGLKTHANTKVPAKNEVLLYLYQMCL